MSSSIFSDWFTRHSWEFGILHFWALVRRLELPLTSLEVQETELGLMKNRQLLFQNLGARAGSLIGVTVFSPDETNSGLVSAAVDSYQPAGFPVVLQAYTAILVDVSVILKGNPNLKTLLVSLGNEARIGVSYLVSTKPKRNAKDGTQGRIDFFELKFDPGLTKVEV